MFIKSLINLIRSELKDRGKKNGVIFFICNTLFSLSFLALIESLNSFKGISIENIIITLILGIISIITGNNISLVLSTLKELNQAERNRGALEINSNLEFDSLQKIESAAREASEDYPIQKRLTDKAVEGIDKMSLEELKQLTVLLNQEIYFENVIAHYLSIHPEETIDSVIKKSLTYEIK